MTKKCLEAHRAYGIKFRWEKVMKTKDLLSFQILMRWWGAPIKQAIFLRLTIVFLFLNRGYKCHK